jgi:hypothetical protein
VSTDLRTLCPAPFVTSDSSLRRNLLLPVAFPPFFNGAGAITPSLLFVTYFGMFWPLSYTSPSLELTQFLVCYRPICFLPPPLSAPHQSLLLYHFDWVFTILESSCSEKAENFTFDLWWILKQCFFRLWPTTEHPVEMVQYCWLNPRISQLLDLPTNQ